MKIKGSRIALAAAGITAFGAASAASLGGLNSKSVGSNDTVVAACDTVGGVNIAYTTGYVAAAGKYRVTGATLSSIDSACGGHTAAVTLKGAAGAELASGSLAVPTGGGSMNITLTGSADAEALVGASIVISN